MVLLYAQLHFSTTSGKWAGAVSFYKTIGGEFVAMALGLANDAYHQNPQRICTSKQVCPECARRKKAKPF
jgi:hypothetical protein